MGIGMINKQKLENIVDDGNMAFEQAELNAYSKDISLVNSIRPTQSESILPEPR